MVALEARTLFSLVLVCVLLPLALWTDATVAQFGVADWTARGSIVQPWGGGLVYLGRRR